MNDQARDAGTEPAGHMDEIDAEAFPTSYDRPIDMVREVARIHGARDSATRVRA
ncbi:hypothetical protein BH09PSE6_BH09PSE6_00980 [soil metagenome]